MLMLILPPAFYWVAVHPCFLCHSFEGLAVSAIGQVLGFSYVDAPGAQNFKVTEPMSADVCAQPEAYLAKTGVDILSVLTVRAAPARAGGVQACVGRSRPRPRAACCGIQRGGEERSSVGSRHPLCATRPRAARLRRCRTRTAQTTA